MIALLGRDEEHFTSTPERSDPVDGEPEAVARLKFWIGLARERLPDRLTDEPSVVGLDAADLICENDLPMMRWLLEYGLPGDGRDKASERALRVIGRRAEEGPLPSAGGRSEKELADRPEVLAHERGERKGRKIAARNVSTPDRPSPADRERSLEDLIFELYPYPRERWLRLFTKRAGGRGELVRHHRARYPGISRATAYEDLKVVRGRIYPAQPKKVQV
jgi:hypothetical protein